MKIDNKLIPEFALRLIKCLNTEGYSAYLVGGCVRDIIMGVKPHDFDITSSAKPEEVIIVLKKYNIKYFTTGIEFGTVVALDENNEKFEVTTYRSESTYSDNRHPDKVKFESTIDKDLARRDFTINAMAYNPVTSELIDLFGGTEDINNKLIRTVGNADDRFSEDALRIIRALRFAIRYGFDIEDETFKSMEKNKELIDNVSKERITSELEKILTSGKPVKDLFIKASNIIFQMIPELEVTYKFWQNNKYHKHDVYEHILYVVDYCNTTNFDIKLAALLHDIGKPQAYVEDEEGHGHFYGHPEVSYEISKELLKKDFRLTTKQYENVLNLILYHDMACEPTKKSVRKKLCKHGEEFVRDWLILKKADNDDHIFPSTYKYKVDTDKIEVILNEIIKDNECFSLKDLQITGKDVMNILGIKSGKQVGETLNILLDKVISGEIKNSKEVLLEEVSKLQ